ncbi:Sulfur carrier protein TtuD [Koleobacter methoxysyntrophicus]|jgi:thiosulfate/3-mercaptopyruvate sulfurtransferase|uniref:thiosulfate sulfurtransferase n=1 Tax=Koleobacter methoxysyntrophicus TaxID=2751313 RepID=A0A8A0RNW6_9FIRM|nr:sulfurtransferase [Koleobacter methoxysyntrophicus]QSQ09117.1 Sulfur carrier protein TtuD [Koleobacter methoxysyntrophicus]
MKKSFAVVVSLLIIVSMILTITGCGKKVEAPEDTSIAKKGYKNPQYLIGADKLKELIDSGKENLVIVDTRPKAKYILGHIPGAVNTWREDYSDPNHEIPGMIAPKEQMEKLLGSLGISNDTHVVIYDDNGDLDAARFWWVLYVYGHEKMQLLDGGLDVWKAKGFETEMSAPEIKPAEYKITKVNEQYIASTQEVKDAINKEGYVILDTRSKEEYTGEKLLKGAHRKGRIPAAVWIEWTQALNEDKTFKTAEELKELYESKGITPDLKTIYPYCQSAVRAAHTFFVLKLLGYENVKNYDASWLGWSKDESLPIETGE